MADGVVDRVAKDRRGQQQDDDDDPDVRAGVGGRQGAGREQQRVAGQERRDDQARLGEHDQEQQGVDPDAIQLDELRQLGVKVEDKVEEGFEHWGTSQGGRGTGGSVDQGTVTPALSQREREF